VENITQAISRDILAHAMKTLQKEHIVGHVHDEIILEAEKDTDVQQICRQMGRTPAWIPGSYFGPTDISASITGRTEKTTRETTCQLHSASFTLHVSTAHDILFL